MKKRCYIAGAGEFSKNILPKDGDYVIAADAGYAALLSHNITPYLIIGDFDSLSPDLLSAVSDHPNVIRSKAEKDDTDMMLAVKKGLELGFKEFIINGGLGGRLDHTLASIQTLEYIINRDADAALVGQSLYITAVKNGEFRFKPDSKQNSTVSIFCAGKKAEGVTLKGLKYPLNNATVTSDYPIGISNETTGKPASISVTKGTLIIMLDGGIPEIC